MGQLCAIGLPKVRFTDQSCLGCTFRDGEVQVCAVDFAMVSKIELMREEKWGEEREGKMSGKLFSCTFNGCPGLTVRFQNREM